VLKAVAIEVFPMETMTQRDGDYSEIAAPAETGWVENQELVNGGWLNPLDVEPVSGKWVVPVEVSPEDPYDEISAPQAAQIGEYVNEQDSFGFAALHETAPNLWDDPVPELSSLETSDVPGEAGPLTFGAIAHTPNVEYSNEHEAFGIAYPSKYIAHVEYLNEQEVIGRGEPSKYELKEDGQNVLEFTASDVQLLEDGMNVETETLVDGIEDGSGEHNTPWFDQVQAELTASNVQAPECGLIVEEEKCVPEVDENEGYVELSSTPWFDQVQAVVEQY
jgi:hypothetical protein